MARTRLVAVIGGQMKAIAGSVIGSLVTLLVVLPLVFTGQINAQFLSQAASTPPATIPYQGTLTDASGTPITDSVTVNPSQSRSKNITLRVRNPAPTYTHTRG